MMDQVQAQVLLATLDACDEAREWFTSSGLSPQQAWETCPHGDWMLWLATQLEIDRRQLVLAACGCARLVLHLVPEGEDLPRLAIETAERWGRGEDGVTLEDVRAAANATYATANATYAATYAATTARHAATTADCATYAADCAAIAADYAATTADNTLARCADIVRQHISWQDIEVMCEQQTIKSNTLNKGQK